MSSPKYRRSSTRWREKPDVPSDELVEDALIGYFHELECAREMLDRRYDDLESGKVKLISGDEVKARLRAKSDSRHAGLS